MGLHASLITFRLLLLKTSGYCNRARTLCSGDFFCSAILLLTESKECVHGMDMNIVLTILEEYGLASIYHRNHWHGNYPLFTLEGALYVDDLLENINFKDTALLLGVLPELWAQERVDISSSESGLNLIAASDPTLHNLIQVHLSRAAQEIQRCNQTLADEQNLLEDTLSEAAKWDRRPVNLRNLTLQDRRERAHALAGQHVDETGLDTALEEIDWPLPAGEELLRGL